MTGLSAKLLRHDMDKVRRKVAYLCLVSSMLTYFMALTLRSDSYSSSIKAHIHLSNSLKQERISPSVTLLREERNLDDNLDSKALKRQRLLKDYIDMATRTRDVRAKKLPDMIVAGVEKCGTGPLRWMLLRHPMILSTDLAEMHYFGREHRKSIEYYLNHMPNSTSYEVVFEKTPAYFISPDAATEIRKMIPHVKIVLVFCDPVNRTYSDYVQEAALRNVNVDLSTLVHNLTTIFSPELKKRQHDAAATLDFIYKMHRRKHVSHILSAGLYYYHLQRWLKDFNFSNIHVVDGEALILNPGSELEKVQEFLQIPKLVIEEDFVKGPNGFYCYEGPSIRTNNSNYIVMKADKPTCMPNRQKGRTRLGNWRFQPSKELVNQLRKFYEPYNKKLFAFLGRAFPWQTPVL